MKTLSHLFDFLPQTQDSPPSPKLLFILAYLVLAFKAVTPCLVTYLGLVSSLLLIGNLKSSFPCRSFCQRLQGALLPRVGGWLTAAAEWLVSFTSSGGTPSSLFVSFLPEGLKSSEPSDRLKCAPPVAICQTRSCSWSLRLLTPYSVFTVGQVKLVFTNKMPLFLVFSPPSASVIILLWPLGNGLHKRNWLSSYVLYDLKKFESLYQNID